jgi:hypothetical protein
MALETIHGIEKGISRLYCQPTDIEVAMPQGSARPLSKAGKAYQALFAEYRDALEKVLPIAAAWWSGIITSQMKGTSQSREEATTNAFLQRIAGPASDPQVIAVVRTSWLKCAQLNAAAPEADRVPPQEVLLGWLVEAGESDLVQLITCMPYWPIGLDASGNWC